MSVDAHPRRHTNMPPERTAWNQYSTADIGCHRHGCTFHATVQRSTRHKQTRTKRERDGLEPQNQISSHPCRGARADRHHLNRPYRRQLRWVLVRAHGTMFPAVYQSESWHALVLRHCSKPHEAPDPRLLTRQLSDPSGERTTLRSSQPLRQLNVTFHPP
jgi:hypothetical protein